MMGSEKWKIHISHDFHRKSRIYYSFNSTFNQARCYFLFEFKGKKKFPLQE